MIRESFTLILLALVPLSLDKVNVHVERQEIRGLSKAECEQYRKEVKQDRHIKANCVSSDLSRKATVVQRKRQPT